MSERLSYTFREYAEAHGLGVSAVWKAYYRGKLPQAFRLWEGGELRIPHDQILQAVREAWAINNSERRHNR